MKVLNHGTLADKIFNVQRSHDSETILILRPQLFLIENTIYIYIYVYIVIGKIEILVIVICLYTKNNAPHTFKLLNILSIIVKYQSQVYVKI